MLALFLILAGTAQAAISGPATVIDGGTIEVQGIRLKLWGIAAPHAGEICDRNGEPYPCGEEAADFLAGKLAGKSVSCQRRRDPIDQPAVAICTFPARICPAEEPCFETTQNVQMAMVYWGYAKDDPQCSDAAFAELEAQARANRWGLWNGVFQSTGVEQRDVSAASQALAPSQD